MKMWKCPSLCDELLIQCPDIKEKNLAGTIIRTSHCPLCGKEMMFYMKNPKITNFIINKIGEQK